MLKLLKNPFVLGAIALILTVAVIIVDYATDNNQGIATSIAVWGLSALIVAAAIGRWIYHLRHRK